MNTALGDALQKAFDNKKNDYSNFVWKGEKRKDGDKYVQESEKLVDMSPERLKECWKHCEKMLHNDDPKHLGRYNVLEEVTSQINKCNTELLLRYFENTYQRRENTVATKRFSLMVSLRQLMSNNSEISDWSIVPISKISDDLPAEFQEINIADVLDGCTDNLGVFSKQHLTMTFITKMGLWFTKSEENELKGPNNSNTERLKMAKERLHLPSKLVLRLSEKGLSYHEMRAMLTLPKKQKYSDMTTEQLLTLRNKVLLRLSREVDSHIFSWNRLKRQIEMVAKSKGINLND
jgi:hypothetical protein